MQVGGVRTGAGAGRVEPCSTCLAGVTHLLLVPALEGHVGEQRESQGGGIHTSFGHTSRRNQEDRGHQRYYTRATHTTALTPHGDARGWRVACVQCLHLFPLRACSPSCLRKSSVRVEDPEALSPPENTWDSSRRL